MVVICRRQYEYDHYDLRDFKSRIVPCSIRAGGERRTRATRGTGCSPPRYIKSGRRAQMKASEGPEQREGCRGIAEASTLASSSFEQKPSKG